MGDGMRREKSELESALVAEATAMEEAEQLKRDLERSDQMRQSYISHNWPYVVVGSTAYAESLPAGVYYLNDHTILSKIADAMPTSNFYCLKYTGTVNDGSR